MRSTAALIAPAGLSDPAPRRAANSEASGNPLVFPECDDVSDVHHQTPPSSAPATSDGPVPLKRVRMWTASIRKKPLLETSPSTTATITPHKTEAFESPTRITNTDAVVSHASGQCQKPLLVCARANALSPHSTATKLIIVLFDSSASHTSCSTMLALELQLPVSSSGTDTAGKASALPFLTTQISVVLQGAPAVTIPVTLAPMPSRSVPTPATYKRNHSPRQSDFPPPAALRIRPHIIIGHDALHLFRVPVLDDATLEPTSDASITQCQPLSASDGNPSELIPVLTDAHRKTSAELPPNGSIGNPCEPDSDLSDAAPTIDAAQRSFAPGGPSTRNPKSMGKKSNYADGPEVANVAVGQDSLSQPVAMPPNPGSGHPLMGNAVGGRSPPGNATNHRMREVAAAAATLNVTMVDTAIRVDLRDNQRIVTAQQTIARDVYVMPHPPALPTLTGLTASGVTPGQLQTAANAAAALTSAPATPDHAARGAPAAQVLSLDRSPWNPQDVQLPTQIQPPVNINQFGFTSPRTGEDGNRIYTGFEPLVACNDHGRAATHLSLELSLRDYKRLCRGVFGPRRATGTSRIHSFGDMFCVRWAEKFSHFPKTDGNPSVAEGSAGNPAELTRKPNFAVHDFMNTVLRHEPSAVPKTMNRANDRLFGHAVEMIYIFCCPDELALGPGSVLDHLFSLRQHFSKEFPYVQCFLVLPSCVLEKHDPYRHSIQRILAAQANSFANVTLVWFPTDEQLSDIFEAAFRNNTRPAWQTALQSSDGNPSDAGILLRKAFWKQRYDVTLWPHDGFNREQARIDEVASLEDVHDLEQQQQPPPSSRAPPNAGDAPPAMDYEQSNRGPADTEGNPSVAEIPLPAQEEPPRTRASTAESSGVEVIERDDSPGVLSNFSISPAPGPTTDVMQLFQHMLTINTIQPDVQPQIDRQSLAVLYPRATQDILDKLWADIQKLKETFYSLHQPGAQAVGTANAVPQPEPGEAQFDAHDADAEMPDSTSEQLTDEERRQRLHELLYADEDRSPSRAPSPEYESLPEDYEFQPDDRRAMKDVPDDDLEAHLETLQPVDLTEQIDAYAQREQGQSPANPDEQGVEAAEARQSEPPSPIGEESTGGTTDRSTSQISDPYTHDGPTGSDDW